MKIPVIINNRDLLIWPKAMLERIKNYDDVGEIVIVDNGSSYQPLLDWYTTNPCTVILASNMGHAGAWISGIIKEIGSPLYVVTDSDMGLEDTPDNTLLYLKEQLEELNIDKIGLGLNWGIVQEKSPYYNRLNLYEKDRWTKSAIKNNVYLDVQIDTTFALYKSPDYFIGGGSTTFPYVARHYPWELSLEEVNENKEFKYYLQHASSSCSYKGVVPLFR
jgi:glycosyltransferase involved in cell wall biosynthesis